MIARLGAYERNLVAARVARLWIGALYVFWRALVKQVLCCKGMARRAMADNHFVYRFLLVSEV
jgi:hypothetical protein